MAVEFALLIVLPGCVGFISKDGPAAPEFASSAAATGISPQPVPYALVPLSAEAIRILNKLSDGTDPVFSSDARSVKPSQVRIQAGDILSLTVFEATSGGLFIPTDAGSRSGNFVTIPNVQVDASGEIDTPYAGPVSVIGKTPRDVGKEIAVRLSKRAIDPQVVVTMVERRSNEVAVLGDVSQPLRFSLDPGGIRVLDALARAGGPKDPDYECIVTIQRHGDIQRARMSRIIKIPSQNVQLRSGDIVYVEHSPKSFVTLGATVAPGAVGGINNRRFTFDNEAESLSEALAKSGGLDDTRADPRSLFLYRPQPKEALREMGLDVTNFEANIVPTIFRVDLSSPDAFFLTSALAMKNNDFMFVSNAVAPDLNKYLGVIENAAEPAYNITESAAAIHTIR